MSGTDQESAVTSDPSDQGTTATEPSGDAGTPSDAAPSAAEFEEAFASVEPEIDDSELAVIEPPSADEAIAGEGADLVNAGVQLIKMIANSASVSFSKDGFASALPAGVTAEDLAGWRPNKRALVLGTGGAASAWWEVWNVEWNATVLVTFMYGGNAGGTGAYVDQAHVALDNVVLPPDFTFEVEAAFPSKGLRMEPPSVGGIQLTLTWRLKGFLGQLLAAEKSRVMILLGTGAVQDV